MMLIKYTDLKERYPSSKYIVDEDETSDESTILNFINNNKKYFNNALNYINHVYEYIDIKIRAGFAVSGDDIETRFFQNKKKAIAYYESLPEHLDPRFHERSGMVTLPHEVDKVIIFTLNDDDIRYEATSITTNKIKNLFLNSKKDILSEAQQKLINTGKSWLSVSALMGVIESKLEREIGLHRWDIENQSLSENLVTDSISPDSPLLILIHGLGSDTFDSFNSLIENLTPPEWSSISKKFGTQIYGFEYNSFSMTPLESAVLLVEALPANAKISMLTHSSGGLIGDLLCLSPIEASLIKQYKHEMLPNQEESKDTQVLLNERTKKDQTDLKTLNKLLTIKNLQIDRYVRVATPASSVKLVSNKFSTFISNLLDIKRLRFSESDDIEERDIASAFKRIALEIVDNEIDASLVPGVEPMLCNSPMGMLLSRVPRKDNIKMSVLGGITENISTINPIYKIDNDSDLLVDIQSVRSGVAQSDDTYELICKKQNINHLSYFLNNFICSSVASWLCKDTPEEIRDFKQLKTEGNKLANRDQGKTTEPISETSLLPIVFLIPGIMGSHLEVRRENEKVTAGDKVWLDFVEIATGGVSQLNFYKRRTDSKDVFPEKLLNPIYGELSDFLERTHHVVPFAYDWRESIKDTADTLAEMISKTLDDTEKNKNPLRILAHSMGGLVSRAMIAQHPKVWSRIVERSDSHLVMLGTPNKGSYQTIESLLCKTDSIRKLTMLDQLHNGQEVTDIISRFPGLLELLPLPDLVNSNLNKLKIKDDRFDWYNSEMWKDLELLNKDFWFGDGIVGIPTSSSLKNAKGNWESLNKKEKKLLNHGDSSINTITEKISYVYGISNWTTCGLTNKDNKLLFLKTSDGDGSVTWESGKLHWLPKSHYWYMPADHAGLTSTEEYFPAILDLLEEGSTVRLSQTPPVSRSLKRIKTVDVGPTSYPGKNDIFYSIMGSKPSITVEYETPQRLDVCITAMDLRDIQSPIIGGHYITDPLGGAEEKIDKYLVNGALKRRERIGNYASEIGSSTIVISNENQLELETISGKGAIIVGLGEWGEINASRIEETITEGVLRYLLEYYERCPQDNSPPSSLKLHSLLIGQNSTNHISVESSIDAIVTGVCKANRKFNAIMKESSDLHISNLEFIEYYHDTAITAAHAISDLNKRIGIDLQRMHIKINTNNYLKEPGSPHYRLSVKPPTNYWPRMMVTTADDDLEKCTPECTEKLKKLYGYPTNNEFEHNNHLSTNPNHTAVPNTSYGVAENLKFIMLSERARAEAQIQQRQPGLIENIISKAMKDSSRNADLCRTLFQLIVPLEFKSSLRLGQNLLLVLDGYTANLPWEMVQADDEPLILKTAMVRQFVSMRYRHVVNSSDCNYACVIGNPSTAGFYDYFDAEGSPGNEVDQGLASLTGARDEAIAIHNVLRENKYEVTPLYPSKNNDKTGNSAIEVFNALFKNPYRIIVIAAHGIVNAKRINGKKQTGVVLSDGAMITAAEIKQMETVPELVFLNCCHLAQTNNESFNPFGEYNKLAYSLSRELIEMGVRCVIAAGWAVNDDAACTFSKTFFEEFISENNNFGKSVWKARKKIFEEYHDTNTWGAYQAYGDPAYRLDPTQDEENESNKQTFVSPYELIKELSHLFESIRHNKNMSFYILDQKVNKLLTSTSNKWDNEPKVKYALGEVYAEIGLDGYSKAIEAYQYGILQEDCQGNIPVKAIEQLANIESRSGEAKGNQEGLNEVDRGIDRLNKLIETTASSDETSEFLPASTVERYSLMGSAYKRRANVLLKMKELGLKLNPDSKSEPKQKRKRKIFWDDIAKALKASRDYYCKGEELDLPLNENLYPTLNRLQYDALLLITGYEDTFNIDKKANIKLLEECQQLAKSNFEQSYNFFHRIIITDVALTKLLTEQCGDNFKTNEKKIIKAYKKAIKTVHGSPREISSVIDQIRFLGKFLSTSKKNKDITKSLNDIHDALKERFM